MAGEAFFPEWISHMLEIMGGAATGGAGLQVFQTYMGRKKTSADAEVSLAVAKKSEAEAKQIFGDIVDERLKILLEGLYHQVEWLEKKTMRLEKQVAEQDEQIASQQNEIGVLRADLAKCLSQHGGSA